MSKVTIRELEEAIRRLHTLAMNKCMACVSYAEQAAAGEILAVTRPIMDRLDGQGRKP